MIYQVIAQLVSLLLDLFTTKLRSEQQKDLEILLLRRQLRILQRHHPTTPHLARWEKLGLAVLAAHFNDLGRGAKTKLSEVLLLFKPDTVLKWHRELVRRKWTFDNKRHNGRPATSDDIQELLLRFAQENPSWGYSKLQGELLKLGYHIGRSTVRDILKRQHIAPAPQRTKKGGSWSNLLSHYGLQILATDFFTVETVLLKTLHALFFIEIGSRRVHFAGCTAHPTAEWVTQQARQLTWRLQDEQLSMRFLIHDRDAKFPTSFDRVFAAEGIEILRTPYRTPTANAFAERWVRSVREECLDKLLIVNEAHLHRVLSEYVGYFNNARPHQGIEQRCPIPIESGHQHGVVKRRDVLGGIIHDYNRAAA
ncbi:MAG: integrase core domain-containing protein [Chloroflexota bacterium]|nr:integrase core domain-containing protein [Chloroflexota bacterium]